MEKEKNVTKIKEITEAPVATPDVAPATPTAPVAPVKEIAIQPIQNMQVVNALLRRENAILQHRLAEQALELTVRGIAFEYAVDPNKYGIDTNRSLLVLREDNQGV